MIATPPPQTLGPCSGPLLLRLGLPAIALLMVAAHRVRERRGGVTPVLMSVNGLTFLIA